MKKVHKAPSEWGDRWRSVLNSIKQTKAVRSSRCVIVQGDSRELLRRLPPRSVSCVLTSPPYGSLKNYGSRGQVGYGQDLAKEYLPDLRKIFEELHRIVVEGGALWLVLDTVKTNGRAQFLVGRCTISSYGIKEGRFHGLILDDSAPCASLLCSSARGS